MRLIDADALMDAHGMKHDCAECDKELRGASKTCEFDRDYTKMDFCGWLEDASTVQPGTKWIPITERLPEERDSIFAKFKGTDRWNKAMWEKQSDRVLVTVEYEDKTRAVEVAYTIDGKWKYRTAVVDRYPVAWQPFPDPYKPEEEE